MERQEFLQALKKAYQEDPCKVLPNTIWKTEDKLPDFQHSIVRENGEVVGLKAWDQQGLNVFWNKDRKIDEYFQEISETFQQH